jgi:hypothetical protein
MKVIVATPLPDFRLKLSFDNGEVGVVDLSALASLGVFNAWRTPGLFNDVFVSSEGAVAWPGQIDLCADALYLCMSGKAPGDVFPALHLPAQQE